MAFETPVSRLLTPNFDDILVTEVRAVTPQNDALRKKGSKHPDGNRYPNHELVWIEKAQGDKDEEVWYFVCKYQKQGQYNWEFTQVGELKFPAVKQTWIIPRKDFTGLTMDLDAPPARGLTLTKMRVEQVRSQEKWIDSKFVVLVAIWMDISSGYNEWTVDQKLKMVQQNVTTVVAGQATPGALDSAQQSFLGGNKSLKIIPSLDISNSAPYKEYERDEKFGFLIQTDVSAVSGDETAPTGHGSSQEYYGFDASIRKERNIDTDALDAFLVSLPSRANLNIPDVLLSVEIIWNKAESSATFAGDWEGVSTGTTRHLSGDESANAEASATLSPDIVWAMRGYFGTNIPSTVHFCFLPFPFDTSDVLTKVGAAAEWPLFKPESHVISMIGGGVGVQARVNVAASYSLNDSNETTEQQEGLGEGVNYSIRNDSKLIPPCIHEAITFTGDSEQTATATAEAAVGWIGTGGFPTIDASHSIEKTMDGSVYPSSLDATSPSEVPTEGIYLIDLKCEIYGHGYAMCMVETIDASIFA